ncbi:MAG: hypothetical protein RLZZ401_1514 [Pseudomonadota bacterium]|jgi:hypothetical protein
MPEIVFNGKEYVYNHHLTVPYLTEDSVSRLVLLETKGAHLAGKRLTA